MPLLETTIAYLHQKKSYLRKTKFCVNAVMTFTSMPTDAGNSFIVAQNDINHLVNVSVIVVLTYTVYYGADC